MFFPYFPYFIFSVKNFTYQGLWFTTLSANTVRTGKINDKSDFNAVENPPENFNNYVINVPDTVSDDVTSYTVVEIGTRSFRSCSNAKIEYLSKYITSIGFSAFDIIYLEKFPTELMPSVESFDQLSFASNYFTLVELPSSLKFIGDAAFSYDRITEIKIPENSIYFSLDEQGALYDFRKTRLIWVPNLEKFDIPFTVQYISRDLFVRKQIKKIVLPPMIRSIGYRAFYQCPNLHTIVITGNLYSVDQSAFINLSSIRLIDYYGTTRLKSVIIESENIQIYVCNQYQWEKAFGIIAHKEGNCPLFNIIKSKKCNCLQKRSSSYFVIICYLLN